MTTTKQYFKVKNGLEFPRQDALTVTDDGGPSIRPSLLLDFAKTKKLDPRITFSRPTTATYYDGKTVVKAEENLQINSQSFNFTNSGVTVQTDTTTAPDGTTTADSIFEGTTTGRHVSEWESGTVTYLPGYYTISVFAKPNGRNVMSIYIGNASHILGAYFDILNGTYCFYKQVGTIVTISGTPTISLASNGWYRVILTVNVSSTLTSASRGIAISDRASDTGAYLYSSASYTGTGSVGIYAWGAQLEQRSFATTYTPTTTAPITNYIPVLQTAETNAARFDHDPITGESKGLLIEESRTNLLKYSDQIGVGSWANGRTITYCNTIVSPDGNITASKITGDPTQSGNKRLYQAVTTASGSAYTFSVYAKAGEMPKLRILFGASNESAYSNGDAMFDLTNGTISSGATATITPIGNGWYRCSVTATTTQTASTCYLYPSTSSNNTGFTGDGYSGVYVWGSQLEAGSFSTSYIPTPLTYTGRSSTATYKAADGLIQTAAANVARYEPNASGGSNMLLEGAASNLLTYTEYLDNSVVLKTRCNVAANSSMSPDGLMNADKIFDDTSASLSHYIDIANLSVTANQTLTYSVYAKAENRSIFVLGLRSNDLVSSVYAEFNLTAVTSSNRGVAGSGSYTTSSITPVGGGWYRCSVTGIIDSSSTSARVQLYLETTTGSFYYTGDGVSGLYIWGAQLESGSVATSYIPSTETHTGRTSTATYYDSTGTIRTAASGQPRYTYNPSLLTAPPKLLLEAQATNLATYSQAMSSGGNTANTITDNSTTSPDGTANASLVVPTATLAFHRIFRNISCTSGSVYTTSFYVKPAGYRYIRLEVATTGVWYFDTTTCTVRQPEGVGLGISYSMTPLPNGWFYCSATYTSGATNTVQFIYSTPIINAQITGDGTSGSYIWGWQVETGYAPTSYIPTTSAAVTRAADTSTSAAGSRAADVYSSSQVTRSADFTSIIGSNYTTWFRNDEGTFYTDTTSFGLGSGATRVIEASNGAANTISLMYTSAGAYSYNSDVNSMGVSNGVSIAGKAVYALAYKTNDAALCTNGGSVSTDTSVQIPNGLSRLDIGHSTYYTPRQLNGTIKKIAYYPKRLSNTELQSITS